jgi:hypothetical protein
MTDDHNIQRVLFKPVQYGALTQLHCILVHFPLWTVAGMARILFLLPKFPLIETCPFLTSAFFQQN